MDNSKENNKLIWQGEVFKRKLSILYNPQNARILYFIWENKDLKHMCTVTIMNEVALNPEENIEALIKLAEGNLSYVCESARNEYRKYREAGKALH